eukprot:gene15903-22036_t
MELTWGTVSAVAVLLLVVHVAFSPIARWRLRHIPGPMPWPVLGNLVKMRSMGSSVFFEHCARCYGPVFQVSMGRTPILVITDPELVNRAGSRILNHWMFTTGSLQGIALEMEQAGLLAARGDYWRLVRRLWQPAFSPASLRGYIPLMDDVLSKFTASLDAKVAAAESAGQRLSMDIWSELQKMTLQVVGSTAYGVDFKTLDDIGHDVTDEHPLDVPPETYDSAASMHRKGFNTVNTRIGNGEAKRDQEEVASYHQGAALVEACTMYFKSSSISTGSVYVQLLAMFPELKWLIKICSRNFPDAITNSQQASRGRLIEVSNDLIKRCFLDHLLSNPQSSQLSDLQLSAQAMIFTLAGYETTANALAFCVYLIARHPEVERKLIEEVDSWLDSLPNKGAVGSGDFNPDSLTELKYVEAVFHEALRLYPPAPGTSRLSEEEIVVGPYTVPKRIPIMLSVHVVHRGEAWGEECDSFRPERFIERAELASLDNHSYIPFGVGSRYCVGWRFALHEAKMALVRMYSQYTFELDPGQECLQIKYGMTQSPKNGVWGRPVPRKKSGSV